jgi:hypothetical protein
MFDFMKHTSVRPPTLPEHPVTTLEMEEFQPDFFLDIFAKDFFQVMNALFKKKSGVPQSSSKPVKPAKQSQQSSRKSSNFLELSDFQEMEPTHERPELIVHIIKTLTGVDISGHAVRIVEEIEPPYMMPLLSQLETINRCGVPKQNVRLLFNTFHCLWGRTKAD